MGKKEICGTEEKICRYIVGSPQEPEQEPLSQRNKEGNSKPVAGKEKSQRQKNSSTEKDAGKNNNRS